MLNRQSVLIIAEHADFAGGVTRRWQIERAIPNFTVISSELWDAATLGSFDLAIVVGMSESGLLNVLRTLDTLGSPSICVAEAGSMGIVRSEFSRVQALRLHDGWADSVVVLGMEILRRVDEADHAKRASSIAEATMSYAALGRYMLDTRQSFNNALTSVLGNAELLMIEPGTLSQEKREQVDTIHSMALRLHEMMQRFSSLEAEMLFADKQSQPEIRGRSQAYVSGS